MTLLVLAAHQGEEFVIILPAIMLAGAFFIMRWANKPTSDEEEAQRRANEEAASDEELLEAARDVNGRSLAAVGQVAVEPPHEAHAEGDPGHHDRQGDGISQRLAK